MPLVLLIAPFYKTHASIQWYKRYHLQAYLSLEHIHTSYQSSYPYFPHQWLLSNVHYIELQGGILMPEEI